MGFFCLYAGFLCDVMDFMLNKSCDLKASPISQEDSLYLVCQVIDAYSREETKLLEEARLNPNRISA